MPSFRLRIVYTSYPDNLYRVVDVPACQTLEELSYVLMLTFHAYCDKLYSFHVRGRRYVGRVDYPLAKSLDDSYRLDSDWTLDKLDLTEGDRFSYFYGTGLKVSFTIIVERVLPEEKADIAIVEGRGFGILEDNCRALDYYFENSAHEYLYSPLIGRKVERKDYFGFDVDAFDREQNTRFVLEQRDAVCKNYREAEPMLPCF